MWLWGEYPQVRRQDRFPEIPAPAGPISFGWVIGVEIRRAGILAGQPRRSRGWLALGIVALLIATFLNPLSAFADTDLVIGGQARISYANGDDVRLRDEPSYSGTLIRFLPEGTVLDVVDGPITDSDGNVWYQLSFDGDTGYIVSDYLALDNGAAPRTTNAAPATTAASPASAPRSSVKIRKNRSTRGFLGRNPCAIA